MSDAPTFSISQSVRDREWDDLLEKIPGSHFEQHSGWAAVRVRYGWRVTRILAYHRGNIIGGVQVLSRQLGRFGCIAYIARGPASLPTHRWIEESLVAEVGRLASDNRWLYCVFDYPYHSHALASSMAASGYFSHPPAIPPSGLLTATALLDLKPDETALLSRMNASFRGNIKRSQRNQLSFALGGAEDVPKFRELMLATCARRKATPTPPQADYFAHLWSELGATGKVSLFLVRSGDEVVSAAFAFTISNTIRVWKVGWSGTEGHKDPNRYMWWEIIRWGKANGFHELDFVWIDTEDAKLLAKGIDSPDAFREGTTHFKMGFGGKLHFPPPVQSKMFHPLARLAFKLGGARVLTSRIFQRALAQYWARKSAQ